MNTADIIASKLEALRPELETVPGLWEMFRKCFLSTIETTVQQTPGDTFVITGDIPAMWLRDSTAQVLHYLRFAEEPAVAAMMATIALGSSSSQPKYCMTSPGRWASAARICTYERVWRRNISAKNL